MPRLLFFFVFFFSCSIIAQEQESGVLSDSEMNALSEAMAIDEEKPSEPIQTSGDITPQELDQINEQASSDQTDAIQGLQCEEEFSDSPPFYISTTTNSSDRWKIGTTVDASSNRIVTENFRNEAGAANKRIARGSIVNVRGENREELERLIRENGEGFKVPVSVQSANDTYKRFHSEENLFVEKGDEGYIWSKSLKAPSEENVFILTEDTYLTPDVADSNLKGKGLRPIVNADGDFKRRVCCEVNVSKQEPNCETSYMYNVIGSSENDPYQNKVVFADHTCFEKDIRPLTNESHGHFNDLVNFMNANYNQEIQLTDLEFNDFGRARLPLAWEENSTATISGAGVGDKFVFYKNGDPFQSDTWGRPTTICSLYNLTDRFYDECIAKPGRSTEDCQARVGDLSFVTPGEKSNGKDLLGHSSHESGNCIDLRPFRSDENYGPTEVGGAGYNRALNEEFIDIAKEMGASPIYLNDSGIKNSTYMDDHHNHIHICFPPENSTVAASCSSRRNSAIEAVANSE